MKVLILAGGFAKRLQPLTADKAKTLLPLGGQAVISHIVNKVPENIPIIVSTNSVFEKDFRAWKEQHPERDITIFVENSVSEETKKGSLGAVGLAIEHFAIDEDLLIIGGDNFFTFSIADFLATTSGQPTLAAYDIKNLEDAKKYGVVIADGRKLTNFVEKPESPQSTLVGACFYFVPRDFLSMVSELAVRTPDRIGGVFENFLEKGVESHVYTFDGYWNDIGSFKAYVDAHIHVGSSDQSAILTDETRGNVFVGVNAIDPSCQITNSYIKDSIIMPNSIIKNCRIDTCVVDANSKLENIEIAETIVKQTL